MTTGAINPAISTLFQTLGAENPALGTPAVQTALQNASPEDAVALSEAALQAQNVAGLFNPTSISGSAFDPANLLASLLQSASKGSDTQAPGLQSVLAAIQYQQATALFG
jgi:hypothetical protein